MSTEAHPAESYTATGPCPTHGQGHVLALRGQREGTCLNRYACDCGVDLLVCVEDHEHDVQVRA